MLLTYPWSGKLNNRREVASFPRYLIVMSRSAVI